MVPRDADEATARAAALTSEKIKAQLEGRTVVKFIHVPNRLANVIVR